jgi:hypothetical protein
LLALLSPALAIVATVISALALTTSQKSLKVGQRAYLSATTDVIIESDAGQKNQSNASAHDLKIVVTVKIRNLGNTPAVFVHGREVVRLPVGWHWPNDYPAQTLTYDLTEPELPPNLGPRDDAVWNRVVSVGVDSTTFDEYRRGESGKLMAFGVFEFRDVFDESHELNWCVGIVQGHKIDCGGDLSRSPESVFSFPMDAPEHQRR